MPMAPQLRTLLTQHVEQLAPDLAGMTHYLVVERHDTEADLVRELGFCPIEVTDGVPSWDWLYDHGGWYELIMTVGDSGFLYIMFVEHGEGAIPTLCHNYASRGEEV